MEIHKKLRKSKIFISFLAAVVLVFSFEQSKPKAFVPLAWAAPILYGMAAETLVTMGVKAGSKAILKKQAKNYSDDMALQGKFDWTDLNPYRNKDGSITLSPSANDRAKMAGLISGGIVGSVAIPDGQGGFSCGRPNIIESMPTTGEGAHLFNSYPYQKGGAGSWYVKVNNYVGTTVIDSVVPFGMSAQDTYAEVSIESGDYRVQVYAWYDYYNEYRRFINSVVDSAYSIYGVNEATAASVGESIIKCEDLFLPSTIDNIYQPPMDMTSDYKMPNDHLLRDRPFIIKNVFEPSDIEGPVTWGDIEKQYNGDITQFETVVEGNMDNYLENGLVAENYYTVGEINNYYTDYEQEQSVDEFEPLPVVPDGDSGGGMIPVDPIDRNMLKVITESYSYLADSIDTSLVAMRKVTDGATGIVSFLDQSFRWLPAEWRALFGAAFILGVFAHFFRR